jgi:hypothetical protein
VGEKCRAERLQYAERLRLTAAESIFFSQIDSGASQSQANSDKISPAGTTATLSSIQIEREDRKI